MRPVLFLLAMLLPWSAHAAEKTGVVFNAEGEPLPSATLTTNVSGVGTIADMAGRFTLPLNDEVRWVTFSCVGYQSRQFDVTRIPERVVLARRYYREGGITVRGDRAQAGISPIAFTNYSAHEIERDYKVGEFPLLLQTTPNLYTYTDGGAALGYSYVKIRGFDDKRIATFINGVPLNDPEDQATYFVDLPDFASNITDIQVQRGVGNSLYGGSSFGGAVNIVTSSLNRERQVSISSGFGEYTAGGERVSDIQKSSIEYSSGLIDGRWLFTGRYSDQKTGGYRYNSWYDGWSYYLSLARLDPNMTTELYLYGGPIRMHLAYWGIDRATLDDDRRANPLGYANETDNFNQPHYHLHNTLLLSDRATLSNTLYYIRGEGYYEQLKMLEEYDDFREYGLDTAFIAVDSANLVRQQWVKKSQWGWNPRLDLEHNRGRHSLGGSVFYFESDHWGQVTWIEGITDPAYDPRSRYYEYAGEKIEANLFAQEYYRLNDRLSAQATAMLRFQRYNFDQTRMSAFHGYNYSVDWLFFSPRIGFNYAVSPSLALFASFAVASRTPTDATIYDANDPYILPSLEIERVSADSTRWEFGDPTAKAERIYDIELGGGYHTANYAFNVNLYWMEFRDEILPYGAVDDDGLRRSVNADRSVHTGVEVSSSVTPTAGLMLQGNFSYNHNRIRDYVNNLDGLFVDYSDKTVPGFPDYLGNLIADYRYHGFRGTWRHQLVGKQYMELLNIDSLAIDAFYTSSVSLSYSFPGVLDLGKLTISAHVNNLFNRKYETSGYGGNWAYESEGRIVAEGWAEYFPAPERWYFGEVKLELF